MPKEKVEKTCVWCGTKWLAQNKQAKCCSIPCSRKHHAKKMLDAGICITCNTRDARPGRRDCKICHERDMARKRILRGRQVPKQCVVCHEEYVPARTDQLYCSVRCRARNARSATNARAAGKAPPLTHECRHCKKPMPVAEKFGGRVYCSLRCKESAGLARPLAKPKPRTCQVCEEDYFPSYWRQMTCNDPICIDTRQTNIMCQGALIKVGEFSEQEKKLANDHFDMTMRWKTWRSTHKKTLDNIVRGSPPEPTSRPRWLFARGVGLRQQVRQWLCVLKGSDSDPYTRFGKGGDRDRDQR